MCLNISLCSSHGQSAEERDVKWDVTVAVLVPRGCKSIALHPHSLIFCTLSSGLHTRHLSQTAVAHMICADLVRNIFKRGRDEGVESLSTRSDLHKRSGVRTSDAVDAVWM